jgi:uncharacterized protein (TIGR03435 family)
MTTQRVAAGAVLVLAMTAFSWQLCAQIQALKTMDPAAHPSFDVASIKPSDPDDHSSGFQTQGQRIYFENETVDRMISYAYGVHAKQIVDAPSWFGSERFDIHGVADVEGVPNDAQQKEMLRKLLTERFHLQFQKERRELPCYALTVAKGGPKMTARQSTQGLPDQSGRSNAGRASWRFTNNSMEDLAHFLQFELDRPVVDQTGLKGKFDFNLTWTKDIAPATEENAPPGFFTAIQEQAGLKVEPTKAEVDVLAVTRAEQPTLD